MVVPYDTDKITIFLTKVQNSRALFLLSQAFYFSQGPFYVGISVKLLITYYLHYKTIKTQIQFEN